MNTYGTPHPTVSETRTPTELTFGNLRARVARCIAARDGSPVGSHRRDSYQQEGLHVAILLRSLGGAL